MPITGICKEPLALWPPKAMSQSSRRRLGGQWAPGHGTILPAQRPPLREQVPPPCLGTATHRPLLLPWPHFLTRDHH